MNEKENDSIYQKFEKMAHSEYDIFCDWEIGPTFGGVIVTEMNDKSIVICEDDSGGSYDCRNYRKDLNGWLSGEEKKKYNVLNLEVFQII